MKWIEDFDKYLRMLENGTNLQTHKEVRDYVLTTCWIWTALTVVCIMKLLT